MAAREIIRRPSLCTKVEIWHPKYNTDHGEYEVWISKRKVSYATPIIIVEFTKAKHLLGQRFCVRRDVVERCLVGTNGKIPVYRVPMDRLVAWDTVDEIQRQVDTLFYTSDLRNKE